jgi:hypothetical protein
MKTTGTQYWEHAESLEEYLNIKGDLNYGPRRRRIAARPIRS